MDANSQTMEFSIPFAFICAYSRPNFRLCGCAAPWRALQITNFSKIGDRGVPQPQNSVEFRSALYMNICSVRKQKLGQCQWPLKSWAAAPPCSYPKISFGEIDLHAGD
jgi:hypothetical protein